jgi:hypothetical protein
MYINYSLMTQSLIFKQFRTFPTPTPRFRTFPLVGRKSPFQLESFRNVIRAGTRKNQFARLPRHPNFPAGRFQLVSLSLQFP